MMQQLWPQNSIVNVTLMLLCDMEIIFPRPCWITKLRTRGKKHTCDYLINIDFIPTAANTLAGE